MGIHLDINFNFKTEGFKRIAETVAPFNLTWLEIDTHDAPALAEIKRGAPCPIASCETLHGRREFKPFFDNYATDVAIVDVIWNGLNESLKIASMADVYEINVAPHNFYGHLCSAISATFSAIVPNFRVMEIDIDSAPWRDEFYVTVPTIENGEFVLAERSRLGHRREREGGARASAEDDPQRRRTRDLAKFKIATPAGRQLHRRRRRLRPGDGAAGRHRRRDRRRPHRRGRLHQVRPGCRCHLCEGHPHHQEDHRRPAGAVPRHHPGQRRRGQRRREGGHRARHPGDQLPRYVHRGSRRPRDDAAAVHLPPHHRAGSHGARGQVARRPPGAAADSSPDGPDARPGRVRPRRARGRQARQAVRPARHRL